jgi:hypothetical protein
MTFKAVALVAAGVALGFALGGIPPRRELAAARAERDALQARLDDVTRPNLLQAFLPGFAEPSPSGDARGARAAGPDPSAGMTTERGTRGDADAPPAPRGDVAVIGSNEQRTASAPGPAAPGSAPGVPADPASAAARPGADADDDEPRRGRGRRDPRELLARFDQIVTAQRARSAAARSALIEHAELDDAQLKRVDSAVTRMNGKLAGYGEEVIAQVGSEQPPSPAQALGLGHDVSGILFEAQKELDATVGERAEDVDPSALEIWNYVDVEQWRPYVEKQLAAEGSGAAPPPATGEGAAGSSAAPAGPAR